MSKKTLKRKAVKTVIKRIGKRGTKGNYKDVCKIIKLESELRKRSKNTTVEECNELRLWDKLFATLVNADFGCAISANQIGILKRAFLVVFFKDGEPDVQKKFINPIIMDAKDSVKSKNEQCLSFPDKFLDTMRYDWIQIKDELNGEATYTGYMAFILQHCVDHLNGILFTDRAVEKPKVEVKKEVKVEEKKSKKSIKKEKKLKRRKK